MPNKISLQIEKRIPFANGMSFGSVGPYEMIKGSACIGVDPNLEFNSLVTDIKKAPINQNGSVDVVADLYILKPTNISGGNRRILFEFVNRGNKRALQCFSDAPGNNAPIDYVDSGNGFLMRRGYTIVWIGWQGDLPADDELLSVDVPVATDNGNTITGRISSEFIFEDDGLHSVNTGFLSLGALGTASGYASVTLDNEDSTLTRRRLSSDKPIIIPSDEWSFAKEENTDDELSVVASNSDVYLSSGFEPGWIYELTYTAKDPKVLGLGYVAVRDLVSFFKHGEVDSLGNSNPLRDNERGIEKAYCFGRSQAGRVIRDFIYQGFNADFEDLPVFDGALVHVAGAGRICLNHRFAQPSRTASMQFEEHAHYSDRFPFSYAESQDHLTGSIDSILKRPATDPLVMQTDSSDEYWQRHASLVCTDTRGRDLELPEGVRLYLWSSSQHFAIAPDGQKQIHFAKNPPNQLLTSTLFRSLLDHMDRWSTVGASPPPSKMPRVADGTLVSGEEWKRQFPTIPGFAIPSGPNYLELYDYGPDADCGYITVVPPLQITPLQEYTILVPSVDQDGNDIPGIRVAQVQAPLGTHAGWNIRREGFGEGEMAVFYGSSLSFAKDTESAAKCGDPRTPIADRYIDENDYINYVKAAIENLKREGFLLDEDEESVVENSKIAYRMALNIKT